MNIIYKIISDNGQNEQELPFNFLVMSDFTQTETRKSGKVPLTSTIPLTLLKITLIQFSKTKN
ncbi:MAG: type VI secretion system contractile sheath small subunit [Candidatus Adiutrix intracellularis]|nr:type VI secretion system contractile sheath small subunit [Candidatus Adiutrix intracellularis]